MYELNSTNDRIFVQFIFISLFTVVYLCLNLDLTFIFRSNSLALFSHKVKNHQAELIYLHETLSLVFKQFGIVRI